METTLSYASFSTDCPKWKIFAGGEKKTWVRSWWKVSFPKTALELMFPFQNTGIWSKQAGTYPWLPFSSCPRSLIPLLPPPTLENILSRRKRAEATSCPETAPREESFGTPPHSCLLSWSLILQLCLTQHCHLPAAVIPHQWMLSPGISLLSLVLRNSWVTVKLEIALTNK